MLKQSIKFNLQFMPSIKTFHPTTGSAYNHTLLTNEKKTKFSKTEYLEIFLQLKHTSNHTLLTNEKRQTFPKQNIMKFFFN